MDDLTWSHWLSFARTEKHRRKKKKKEKEEKEKERRLKKEAKRADKEDSKAKVITTTLPIVPSEDASLMKVSSMQREAESEARRELEVKIGVLEEALAMSMEEIKERDERHKFELEEARKAAEGALTELTAVRSSLNIGVGDDVNKEGGGEYEEFSALYLSEVPPPPAPTLQSRKPASWKMASIRAALLRLKSAEVAADAACASASAMASFVERHAPIDVQRAPGMQQVLTALITAADAQQQFTMVAGSAGELIEPLVESFEEVDVEGLLNSSWEEWEEENRATSAELGGCDDSNSSSSSSGGGSISSSSSSSSESDSRANISSEFGSGGDEASMKGTKKVKKIKKKTMKRAGMVKKGGKKQMKMGPGKSPLGKKKKKKKKIVKKAADESDEPEPPSDLVPPPFDFYPPLCALQGRVSEIRSQHGSLRSSVESCFAGVGRDLETLNKTFAGVMCRVMDGEREAGGQEEERRRRRTPSGRGSPGREGPSRRVVRQQRERRRQMAEPGTVRICAHVRLANEGKVIEGQTPSYGSGNLKISGSSLELGILGGGDLDILRVRYSRVFAYHGGGSEVELFFNRNIVGEVRPAVVRSVRGEGVGTVTIISAEAGGGDGNRTLLEGEEGDTGLMWEIMKTVFEEIDYNDVKNHGENNARNRAFFESLRVNVEAVEVGGGRVIDLLREGGAKARREQAEEGFEDDKDCKGRIRVNIRSTEDFNKLVGVIASARSLSPNLHSHMVIRVMLETGVGSEKEGGGGDSDGRWSEFVFVDMRVPRVDAQVIHGEDWEDEDEGGVDYDCEGGRYIDTFNEHKMKGKRAKESEGRAKGKGKGKGKGHNMDLLYAQEDVAAIGNILEGRARIREEKKDDFGGGGDRWEERVHGLLETSRLAREIGGGLEGDGEVRFFAQICAERYDELEIRDSASVMLMSSIAMGEGM